MIINNKNIELIIFDWDNTIVDSLGLIRKSINRVVDEIGTEEGQTLVQEDIGKRLSSRQSFPILFGKRYQEAFDLYYKYYQEGISGIDYMPYAQKILDLLGGNIPLAVNSNKREELLFKEVDAKGYGNNFFKSIVGSRANKKDKPYSDGVDEILQKMNLKSNKNILYVGDNITDIKTAENSMITSVLVTSIKEDIVKSDYYYSDLEKFYNIFF